MTAAEQAIKMTEQVFENAMKENPDKDIFEQNLIEFAKFHVKRALEEVNKKAECNIIIMPISRTPFAHIKTESILNAYPLENIK